MNVNDFDKYISSYLDGDLKPSLMNEFEELLEFSDDERLLAFSEGRVKLMQWLVLTPKACN